MDLEWKNQGRILIVWPTTGKTNFAHLQQKFSWGDVIAVNPGKKKLFVRIIQP